MPSLKFTRFVFAIMVFAFLSSNVFAQSKYPPNVKTAPPGNSAAEASDSQYFNKEIAKATEQITLTPNDANNYWWRGYLYLGFKKYDEALKDFDKALDLNKNSFEVYVLRGYAYSGKKLYAEAEKDFNAAVEISQKDTVYSTGDLEIIHYRINRQIELIRCLDDYIYQRPNNPELRRERAGELMKIGRRKDAEADWLKAEEIEIFLKKDVTEHCELRDFLCQIAFFNEKIKIADDLDVPRDLAVYYSGRGAAYFENRSFDDAFKDLNAAIEGVKWQTKVSREELKWKSRPSKYTYTFDDQGNRRSHVYRGIIYFRQGKNDLAFADLKYSVNPAQPEGYAILGDLYRLRKDYGNALVNYEKAIDHDRRNARAYYGRAMVYLKIGDDARELEADEEKAVIAYKRAKEDFDSVIEIDLLNTGGEVYLQRARIYLKLGEPDKAEADIAKAREIDENP